MNDYERQQLEHRRMVYEYEIDKATALSKANDLVKTALDFEEVVSLVYPFLHTEALLNFYEKYIEENIYYNSPLAKALREEE